MDPDRIGTMTLALPDTRVANGLGIHERFVRSTLWLACFLLATLTATPFPDLGDLRLLDPVGDGNRLGQILVIMLTLAFSAFLMAKRDGRSAARSRWRWCSRWHGFSSPRLSLHIRILPCGGSCSPCLRSSTQSPSSCCRQIANTLPASSPQAH